MGGHVNSLNLRPPAEEGKDDGSCFGVDMHSYYGSPVLSQLSVPLAAKSMDESRIVEREERI
jgi:hypothetical protein